MSESLTAIGSWEFTSDHIHQYAFIRNFLSKEECEKIIKKGKELKVKKGTILGSVKSPIRKSNVSWIYPTSDMHWLFRRATDGIMDLNDKFLKYGKHVDRCFEKSVRKLSLSIQLTDPKKYEGGDLKLHNGPDEDASIMSKAQGTLILFPSFILHEVTPVTKGERNSLVSWITGKPFK